MVSIPEERTFEITEEFSGRRVDSSVPELWDNISRAAVQRLISNGFVTVNGKCCPKNYRLREGDTLHITLPPPHLPKALPEDIPLDIVYEDDDLLVVDKPQGMVVHPAPGNPDGTLVNALLYHCGDRLSGINGVLRPGIVHRIDKDTSGLLLVAKNDVAHRSLAGQIKDHSVTRLYEAVVCGNIKSGSGTVDAPIGRDPRERKRMAVTYKNSKNAVTHYSVVARFERYTHITLRLETGRTHQIRVHMAYIGHSVAGDPVYGHKVEELPGQCLHARVIGFVHPRTGAYMEFTSPLPEYFIDFLKKVRT